MLFLRDFLACLLALLFLHGDQRIGDVVLVDVRDVVERFLTDASSGHELDVIDPDVGIEALSTPEWPLEIRAEIMEASILPSEPQTAHFGQNSVPSG